jgi:hypothetical protein
MVKLKISKKFPKMLNSDSAIGFGRNQATALGRSAFFTEANLLFFRMLFHLRIAQKSRVV